MVVHGPKKEPGVVQPQGHKVFLYCGPPLGVGLHWSASRMVSSRPQGKGAKVKEPTIQGEGIMGSGDRPGFTVPLLESLHCSLLLAQMLVMF